MAATGTHSLLVVKKLSRRHSWYWSAGSSPQGGGEDRWRVQGGGWSWSTRAGEVPPGFLHSDLLAVRPEENGTRELV